MSKFQTTIPAPVQAVIDSLPAGAFLHRARLGEDSRSIVIEWEHDPWKTPYTTHVEVAPAALTGEEPLPEVIKGAAGCKRVQNDKVAPTPARSAKKSL